jgi:hypothetical protein
MDKRGLLALILMLSLFIFGCQQQAKKDSASGIFLGGTDAVEFSFVENQPPLQVLDDNQDPFSITINLQNKGEYTVPANKIIASLSGISAEAFSISSLHTALKIPLEGKIKSGDQVIQSSPEELLFDEAIYKHDLNADFPTSLRADICYLYQTRAVSKLCLKKKAVERNTEDKCLVNSNEVSTESSSAPVKIKNVRQRSSGTSQIKLTFTIVNEGKGEVYPPLAFTDKCVEKRLDENRLLLEVSSASGKSRFKCSQLNGASKGEIKLTLKEKIVSCDIPTDSFQEIAFEEPANIILSYFYKGSIEKQITVTDSEQ